MKQCTTKKNKVTGPPQVIPTSIRKPMNEDEKARLLRGNENQNASISSSSWNKGAKTWEERDVTKRAKDILTRRLRDTKASTEVATSSIQVLSVDKLEGSASMLAHTRPVKYIFEFSFTLSWKSNEGTKGRVCFSEIDVLSMNSQEFEVSSYSIDQGDHELGRKHIKALESAIIQSMMLFFEELRTPPGHNE